LSDDKKKLESPELFRDLMKQQVVHVKKFDGGNRSPAEVHRQYGLNGHRCHFCQEPAACKARVLAELTELEKREPEFVAIIKATNEAGPYVPTIATTYGRMVLMEQIFACTQCTPSMKQALGRRKDTYTIVEFDEMGLEASHPLIIGVPR